MKRLLTATALILAATIGTAASAVTIYTDTTATGDTIRGKVQSGSTSYQADNAFSFRVGEGGASGSRAITNTVLGFTLPTLDPGEMIDSANLSFTIQSLDDNGELGNLVVTLLDTANPDALGIALFTESAAPGGTNETVGSTDSVGLKNFSLTGDALALLQSFYGGDETPEQAEVFFRLNNDTTITLDGSIDRFTLAPGSGEPTATLTITAIPEPASLALVGLGSLLILSRRRTA
jgi:hypothetical protein